MQTSLVLYSICLTSQWWDKIKKRQKPQESQKYADDKETPVEWKNNETVDDLSYLDTKFCSEQCKHTGLLGVESCLESDKFVFHFKKVYTKT